MTLPKSLPDPSDPEKALAAAVVLKQLSEKLEIAAVKHAIQQGWTWSEIADSLGVTRQAAHKKHSGHAKKTATKRRS